MDDKQTYPCDALIVGTLYCNATFDSFLCWPPTEAGSMATQGCPPARLSDTSRFAHRTCGEGGLWLGRRPNESSLIGWTNYTPCFPPEVQTLFVKVYDEDDDDAQWKFGIAQGTRYLEIVGFSVSLIALLMSLFIFSYFRSLRNNRTRIHKSLFGAMVVQVLIRLVVYIDQALIRSTLGDHSTYDDVPLRGIDNMPYLCEGSYVLLEYAITVMFMWMFIEGLYLHNMVTANALRERISHVAYYAAGWGLPLVVTAIWATVTWMHYQLQQVKQCWYGYNFTSLYWIMQGPRLGVILINMVFLLNIMRVLIVKLRRSDSTELEKVRKAVRAAMVLLPLLGITNALNMVEAPLDGNVWEFGIWSYSTHFLRSFQGFFIALIYCFCNGEVRQVVVKHYQDRMAMRENGRRYPRKSCFNFWSSSGEGRAGAVARARAIDNGSVAVAERKPAWIRWATLRWLRGSSSSNKMAPDVEMGSLKTDRASSQETNQEPIALETSVSVPAEVDKTESEKVETTNGEAKEDTIEPLSSENNETESKNGESKNVEIKKAFPKKTVPKKAMTKHALAKKALSKGTIAKKAELKRGKCKRNDAIKAQAPLRRKSSADDILIGVRMVKTAPQLIVDMGNDVELHPGSEEIYACNESDDENTPPPIYFGDVDYRRKFVAPLA